MRKFILKRLLLALPTLLGITVLTFCLIRLTPGEAGALEMRWETMEQTRRLYGLDKPLLFNFDVRDRRRAVLSAWEDLYAQVLTDPASERLAEKRQALYRFEKRLIPYLVPLALAEEDPGKRGLLLDALREGARITAAATPGGLAAWWEQAEPSYTPSAMATALRALETGPGEEAGQRIEEIRRDLGGLVLPVVMDMIRTAPERLQRRMTVLAAPWAGYTRSLEEGDGEERFRTARAFLRAWWQKEHLAFREISTFERCWRTFTEAQYPIWLGQILRLDFGHSLIDFRPVTHKVWEAFKVTFSFQIVVLSLIYLLAIPLGIYSAVRQGTHRDRLITLFLFMLYSLPNFWVAYMLIFFLGGGSLDFFPIQGLNSMGAESLTSWDWFLDRLWHMCLPVACMTYGGLAVISRYARAGMIEELSKDYMLTARAKGLSERAVIVRHALRNSMIPILTLVGGLVPALISGSVIVESIFGIPGMGWLGYNAVMQRDYPVVMAIAFFSAALVLAGMLLSDILYALADPRIGYGKER